MSPSGILPTPAEVRDAAARIAGVVTHTPLIPSPALSEIAGGEVLLKLECRQVSGSFKIRGALNALLTFTDDERRYGVVASSAGNHGRGIAMAAELLGVAATVFVPSTAPAIKRDGIAAHGARVDATHPTYDSAETAARHFARTSGATFVGPCTGRTLLAGAGTVAKEVLDDLPSLRTMVVCVGGGGLAGGIGGYLRGMAPAVRIIGVQGVRTNAMSLALASGVPTDIPDLPTLADGLTGLVDAEMLAQGQAALDGIVTVEESEIGEAIAWAHHEHGLTVEGAGAVGIAAIRSRRLRPQAFPAVLTVSGANIDAAKWRGLVGLAGA
ncbi:MAG: pyridoxal-phosphate dependent enzyme [Gemmatimonadetes bacterium]|nr:pyridoxal-phosphate dependent enzyme [Gemmatimonadota bacterium]